MRRRLIPALLLTAILAGCAGTAAADGTRRSDVVSGLDRLRATWDADQAAGVPAAALDPLRRAADQVAASASWWSPIWLGSTGGDALTVLQRDTDLVMASAVALARRPALDLIDAADNFMSTSAAWLPPVDRDLAGGWSARLATTTTPAAVAGLVTEWQHRLEAARGAAVLGQRRLAAATVEGVRFAVVPPEPPLPAAGAVSPADLLTLAQPLVDGAHGRNLDSSRVEALVTQLQGELHAAGDGSATAVQLAAALAGLKQAEDLNDHILTLLAPLQYSVDQALAETTADGATFRASAGRIQAEFEGARGTFQLAAVAQEIGSLQKQITAELTAAQCGHSVVAGKVITVSLSLQEVLFYQDGCVVNAAPVTTGRALLRTPTGTFHVFYKTSPFTMVSPWPPDSPFWYRPSPVSWVMEFNGGGYFLHDAPWEPDTAYGPGSQDGGYASHGCIHIPTSVMQWAYAWTPSGTPVLISA